MLLVPEPMQAPPAPWIVRDDNALFCTEACAEKGIPQPVREPLHCHLATRRNAPPMEIVGAYDAILGFDPLCQEPNYLIGHANGMNMRPIIEEAQKQLAGMQGIVETDNQGKPDEICQ
jgi:hypothetical protein